MPVHEIAKERSKKGRLFGYRCALERDSNENRTVEGDVLSLYDYKHVLPAARVTIYVGRT